MPIDFQICDNMEHTQRSLSHVLFLGDHGIADSPFSKKHKSYTVAMAIDASEKQLSFQQIQGLEEQWVIDVSVDRYWVDLPRVENLKISRGTHNFLQRAALEPQRIQKAVDLGIQRVASDANQHIYVSAIAAGNDLSCEALLKSLEQLDEECEAGNNLKEFNTLLGKTSVLGEHPFDFLEQYGGYEMCAIVGVLLAGTQGQKNMFLDGWSATAALALAARLNKNVLNHVSITHCPDSSICKAFLAKNKIEPLFQGSTDQEGGHYLKRVMARLEA